VSTATQRRPLVLLDIDGVIHDRNPMEEIRFSDDPDATAVQLGVTVIVSHGHRLAFPNYMPTLVRDLDVVAEIWWCTTWRHRANDEIKEHLGIEPLSIVDDGTRAVGLDWKVSTAAPIVEEALAAGRVVCWIEDFAGILPGIDGITYIDTADAGILRPEDIPARLR
jgi:hypothetical protein